MSIRILIADDHAIVRRGLRTLLEGQSGWEVCGEAANGKEAVQRAMELKPDIVVIDIAMPELNGLEAARRILAADSQVEILILTMHQSEEVIHEVLRTGARGYVLKSDADVSLVAAVEALHQHRPFLSSSVTDVILDDYRNDRIPPVTPPLNVVVTSREREVLQLLAGGKSNKDVAVALGISVRTAEVHRASIMHKLGFASLSDLVRYAIRNKVIDL